MNGILFYAMYYYLVYDNIFNRSAQAHCLCKYFRYEHVFQQCFNKMISNVLVFYVRVVLFHNAVAGQFKADI